MLRRYSISTNTGQNENKGKSVLARYELVVAPETGAKLCRIAWQREGGRAVSPRTIHIIAPYTSHGALLLHRNTSSRGTWIISLSEKCLCRQCVQSAYADNILQIERVFSVNELPDYCFCIQRCVKVSSQIAFFTFRLLENYFD